MRTLPKPLPGIKKALRDRGITYDQVARFVGVSWFMVYAVVNGRRKSARVVGAIQKLLGEPGRAA